MKSMKGEMKLVWCPETAFKAYVDTVKEVERRETEDGATAELVGAMAGGWNAQLVVEAWDRGGGATTSLGLSAAVKHTRGRHVCVLPDERAAEEYAAAVRSDYAEVIVGEVDEVMKGLYEVDVLVADWRRADAVRVVRKARSGVRGMVVICRNAGGGRGRMAAAEEAAAAGGRRVMKSVYIPVGSGVHIMHVGVGKEGNGTRNAGGGYGSRWIRHFDRRTGEEHVFRRR